MANPDCGPGDVPRPGIEELEADNERLRALFEQSLGYAMILQPTASGIPDILEANAAACEAHGCTREEMVGRPVAELDDEEGKRLCIDRTKQLLSGVPLTVETNHVRQDGTVFPVAVHANLVEFVTKPPLILTTEYDVSELRRAERERHALEERLRQAEKWKRLGSSQAGSPTTSTIFLPRLSDSPS